VAQMRAVEAQLEERVPDAGARTDPGADSPRTGMTWIELLRPRGNGHRSTGPAPTASTAPVALKCSWPGGRSHPGPEHQRCAREAGDGAG